MNLGRILFLLILCAGIVWILTPDTSVMGAKELSQPTASVQWTSPESLALGSHLAHNVATKVEPALLKRMLEGSTDSYHRLVIEMAHRADLDSLPRDQSRERRHSTVVGHLQQTASETQADLLAFLQEEKAKGRVKEIQPFWILNGISVTADSSTILNLAARHDIGAIREDRCRQWIDPLAISDQNSTSSIGTPWNILQVRAIEAWEALGLDGSGVTIAIMDTGVDWQHPSLQEQYRGYKEGGLAIHQGNWLCTTDEGYLYPVDGNGHGTHVAGIAVGSRDDQGQAIGVAPGAQWIAVKMLNNGGSGYDSWIHAAFEWLMAPAGDLNLAPHVVNGSWGSTNMQDEVFRPDIQALVAAGIVPVFAAGNEGPRSSSIRIPAAYPEAIAVGATDDLDQVAYFSSRGPSSWSEVKPEVTAPGTQIWSSLPGGTFGAYNGTSMASPHVAGLAALLLQADPALTVADLETLITTTAKPIGDQVPNADAGWGRIDVYRAAAVAMHAGHLAGQVTRYPDYKPLPGAQVVVSDRADEQQAIVQTDTAGRYLAALIPGQFDLTVDAFGYQPQTVFDIDVQSYATTTVDLTLDPLPVGVLWGQVRDAETDGPVGAAVQVVGTPAQTTSDPATGNYSLSLPAGTYSLDVGQNGYLRYTIPGIEILANQALRVDIDLVSAPTLLLVDSGPWYYGSQASYFRQALDDNSLVHALWEIRDPNTDIPSLQTLSAYDVTIWSSPLDAPGLIGAGDVISDYLSVGGRLLLTGQDIGYWDGGLSGITWHPYYTRYLGALALSDNAGRSDIVGTPQELLQGLQMPINGTDSARNQYAPDMIDLLDPRKSAVTVQYLEGGNAGLRVSGCQSYRTAYLAAGLEGVGTQESRAEAMHRLVDWLGAPPPLVDAKLYPSRQEAAWLLGSYITYTLEVLNAGAHTDEFTFEFSQADWPATGWNSDFTKPITQSITLGTCQTQTLGVQVEVPPGITWNMSDVVTLTVRSATDPAQFRQAVFVSKAPAPILLVDDHRWYDVLGSYKAALTVNNMPYDLWEINTSPYGDLSGPSLERLRRYPLVIWFTGYAWNSTLTPTDEERLSTYLDGGGRLLLSSQDYLYTSGYTNFARTYLGVAGYTEALTATQVFGAPGSPVGEGLDTVDLYYPFRNWSDALRFSENARPALWAQHAQPVALTMDQSPWKTAFFAFPLEALPEQDLASVIGRTVAWLSPLGDSTMTVDRAGAGDGDELGYTLQARNTGPRLLSQVTVSNTLPPPTTFVAGSLEGPATYDPVTRCVAWKGALAPGDEVVIRYRLLVDQPLPAGTTIENVAHLGEDSGLSLVRVATTRVNAPNLSHSVKQVSAGSTAPRRELTYTLVLENDGVLPAQARLVDPIPLNSQYVSGSAWASTGSFTATPQSLVWSGTIPSGGSATLGISVLPDTSSIASYILNRALLADGWGESHVLEAHTWVESRIFLPFVGRR